MIFDIFCTSLFLNFQGCPTNMCYNMPGRNLAVLTDSSINLAAAAYLSNQAE